MSEPAPLLPEDAPRTAVIRALMAWSQRRASCAGDPPGGRQEAALLAGIAAGHPACWDGFCELVHASGLYLDMLGSAPGLWSHCRLAAGPSWRGIATLTRGVIRQLGAVHARPEAHALGCVAIDAERLWLADHLLYRCQDDLEIGLDCRFYGCARDPDLQGIGEHRYRWSFVQKRWFTHMAGLGAAALPQGGWISSPRWLFPLPAHAVPRHALASPLGQRLWQAAAAAADRCATSISPRPQPWWRDDRLVPAPEWVGRWAERTVRSGFGVLSADDLAGHDGEDPCYLPMILAALAPFAELPAERVWALITCLERAGQRQLAAAGARPPARVRIDLPLPGGGQRLQAERDGTWRCANGWAISRALGGAALMPPFHQLQGLGDWPPSTLLRSGLAEVLLAHAEPVLRPEDAVRQRGTSLEIGKVSWSWNEPGTPSAPPGWERIDREHLAQALARPGWVELGGDMSYAPVTDG